MTVEQLLSALHDLPIDALNKRIFIDGNVNWKMFKEIEIQPLGENAYMITGLDKEPVQLVLPFDKA